MAEETGFVDGRAGVRLFYRWRPVEDAAAVVVVIHGFAEHSGRYDHVMAALEVKGWSSLAIDMRGHGHSSGRRGFINRYEEYLWDVDNAVALARERCPDVPVMMVGHSQGGLVVAAWLLERPSQVAAAAVSSPAIGFGLEVPAWKDKLGQVMSSLWPPLGIPSGIAPEQVSRDPEVVRLYDADPMVFGNATARWYTETMATQQRVLASAGRLQDALLVMQAGADSIVSPEAAGHFYEAVGSADKAYEVYASCYHEIFNEPEKAEVLERLCGWFADHVPTPAPE